MNNLQKRYDDWFEAISGLDLKVRDGEFFVLVGPLISKAARPSAIGSPLAASAAVRVLY